MINEKLFNEISDEFGLDEKLRGKLRERLEAKT